MGDRTRKLMWFGGLWLAGVLAVGGVAAVLRLMLGAAAA